MTYFPRSNELIDTYVNGNINTAKDMYSCMSLLERDEVRVLISEETNISLLRFLRLMEV